MKHVHFAVLVLLTAFAFLPACSAPTVAPTAVPPTLASQPTLANSSASVGGSLTIYAAASLTDAFKTIGQEFEKANPGAKITFNFAGSQDLVTQLGQGARADVFASADLKNMDALKKQDLVASDPQVFARNRLVVIVPKDNRANVQQLKDLAKPGLKLVIADKSVPVGNYALQVLDKLSADPAYGSGFKEAVLKNVVSQENNVKAVVSKISLGEGDVGIVYATDAQTAASKVTTISIPDDMNVIALYPTAVIKGSSRPDLAAKWIAFVLSPQGQAILTQFGFVPPS